MKTQDLIGIILTYWYERGYMPRVWFDPEGGGIRSDMIGGKPLAASRVKGGANG